jgi:sugar (pentulose or hexulose) kinase
LSVADYVAYWLTGTFGTDYSLAGRTLAFRVEHRQWDSQWLRDWGLSVDLFPPAYPSGYPIGKVKQDMAGLRKGIPVAVCGHDHVCASLAMGAFRPGVVFDSMGTAEALVGALEARPLTAEDYANGLQYGCHVVDGLGYWMGGLSTSGGSIDWIRKILFPAGSTYMDLERLLESAVPQPTGILYFPYLLGSGSPHTDPWVRGAFVGLTNTHQNKELFKAVLEGIAFELEYVRQAGEKMTGKAISTLVAAGGGTRYRGWMQIKADISGCRIDVADEPEATLLGAAMTAGIGCGVFASPEEALTAMSLRSYESFRPNMQNHALYKTLYEQGFLSFQDSLRRYFTPNT